jgi:hypothetical protein
LKNEIDEAVQKVGQPCCLFSVQENKFVHLAHFIFTNANRNKNNTYSYQSICFMKGEAVRKERKEENDM